MIPADSIAASAWAVSGRTPVCPVASVERRSSISARTTSRSTSGPEPAACERTNDRCSWARISVGMCRVASAPKPVEMPYAGVGAAASSSTTDRARSIAATASAVSSTGAPFAGDHDDIGQGDGAGADRNDVLHDPHPTQSRRPGEGVATRESSRISDKRRASLRPSET